MPILNKIGNSAEIDPTFSKEQTTVKNYESHPLPTMAMSKMNLMPQTSPPHRVNSASAAHGEVELREVNTERSTPPPPPTATTRTIISSEFQRTYFSSTLPNQARYD